MQEEQNGASFSFIAPSSEELWVRKEFDQNALLESRDFGQKLMDPYLTNKDTIEKCISRGAEWCRFELHSTFQ